MRRKINKLVRGKMRVRYVIIRIEKDVRVIVYIEVDTPVIFVLVLVIIHVLVAVVVVAKVGDGLLARGRVVSGWLADDVVCFVVVD